MALAAETLALHGKPLREHPAAKAMHHAYRGGLLEHVVSMAELGRLVCSHYGELDRDLVLVGVLFHDLGKLRELGAMPANDYTLEGRLIGHVVIGRDLLIERCAAIEGFPADLRMLLEHMILSHQGKKEFASPVEPMTPEALALHFIDDLDSKINQLRASREAAPGMQFHRGLGRYVYLPPLPTPEEAAVEELTGLAAIPAEPHALEVAEMDLPPEEPGSDAEAEDATPVPAAAEVQPELFRVE
jgi:3'-5' exoribonuclease